MCATPYACCCRTRGFTTVAVLTLALGIGANTALFSIVYAVLLKPLPLEQAEDLAMVWSETGRGRGRAKPPADFLDYRKMNTAFEDLAAMALGASPRDVLRLVTGHGIRLAVAGIALGALAAWGLTCVLASVLFGVTPTDPLTFGTIAVLLASVASLASYIPAAVPRRRTRCWCSARSRCLAGRQPVESVGTLALRRPRVTQG